MLSDWSAFSQGLLCFKKYKPCLPDSSKSLLVISVFLLLIESFLPWGSNGISTTIALWHCFLVEIPDSIVPLASLSGGLWSRLFVLQRIKIHWILKLLEKSRFCNLHNTCWILSPGIPIFKVLLLEKYFFPNFRVSA